ncbi:HYR domain-containing protein [Aequorivita sp. H23M31]|uniref:HYR domain-containing protein n=2 Tax=Aequorivita ciconiae TaxID=2494375 RepID=A0A410G7C0_9FLAO|nr:HYR domain-containing protein [Aequorivita sp. H23M31]
MVVELMLVDDGTDTNNMRFGTNNDGFMGESWIKAADCGAPTPTAFAALGLTQDLIVNVLGDGETGVIPIFYCNSQGNNPSYENITNVTYAGINNTTATHSGYNDFTAQSAMVTQGETDQISVTITADGSDYVYAFIDWNQNGILDDAGEVYTLATSTSSAGPHTMDITVPADASLGDTRMRVKVGWLQSTPNPCGNFSYGEIEDYTVNVQAPSGGGGGEPPIIVCPSDITANNDPGLCGAVVNFSPAVAIDPEDGVISTVQTGGPASGTLFPVGVTMVKFSATDSDGNTVTCQFEVTVVDNEAPVVVCQNITIDLDAATGLASITAADVDNGSTDNCAIDTMSLDISSFDCSMIGENTVTLTVTDTAGNSSTCTATVTVQDVTAPEVVCVGGFGDFTETEDFEAATVPAGWTATILSGNANWGFGSGDMPTGPDFPTNAAIFNDDAAGSGEANSAQLLSPSYNLTGATSAEISFDYANQTYQNDGKLIVEVYDGSTWQEVFMFDGISGPTNTGPLDMTAYINPNFQVRFIYDDEGGWSWGAGVDNFLLEYQAASGGGLDVYLDANGQATISPNDLVTSVTEACNYTITAAGTGGGTMGALTTLFASGNNGSAGGAVYFDIIVGPADIEITDIDINTGDAGAFTMDVYTKEGTSVGSETNQGAWTLSSTAAGTSAGLDMPSNAVLASPITLSANTTYGMALVLDGTHGHYYTNGDGTNQNFSNADLALALGAASNAPFTGGIFSPRIFNGTIHYIGGPGSGLDFTCADLGQNIVEVTVTDDSGNSTTCMAVINVIDNTAPVIICSGTPGPVSNVEDFEENTIPSGWTTVIDTGSQNWTFGSGAMPTGGNFTSKAAIFNDDAAGSGSVNKATLYSPVYNITGSSTAEISFDYALQEFLGDGKMTVEAFDGANWQQVFFVDTNTSPTNTGALDVSAYINPAFQVRFIYDDEGGWSYGAGVDNFVLDYEIPTATPVDIQLNENGTANIDPYMLIRSIDEACGVATVAVDVPQVTCADIGTTIPVTVFVSDTSGNVSSCTTMINVVDSVAPVITCPADVTVDPGAGNLFYILPDYFATGEATAIDNCTDPVIITTQDPAVGTALTDGIHTITLTAEDEYGNISTCSFELTVESILVGIDDNVLESGVALYPNPAKNIVNLVNKTNISLDNMVIFDINGKKVNQIDLRAMVGEKSVDVSNLASGVYVIQIVGEKATTVKRLIIE